MSDEEERGLLSRNNMNGPSKTPSKSDVLYFKFLRPCIAEFVATMLFVALGVCSVASSSPALGHGLVLFVVVAATATVSGGHINPAVTLAMAICGGLKPILAPFYIASQLVGAMFGALIAKAIMYAPTYDEISGGVHMLGPGIDAGQAILAEMVATSVLVLAVLMVAFDERNKAVLGPIAIGLSVTGGIYAIGGITGGSLNPARSFGPAVVQNSWDDHYVYWVGPALGSLFSSLIYTLVLAQPDRLWLPVDEPKDE